MSLAKKCVFRGVATAIVTPFRDGKVDYGALGNIIDWQIEEGTNAIVAAGTTGEASTLTESERRALCVFCRDKIAGRVPLIVGAGSNDTAKMTENVKHATADGADALLLITPYYNKATARGMTRSFLLAAESSDVPIILYNVPSRTGVDIPLSVCLELAEHENIVGIKEASGNIGKIAELASALGDKLDLYSGNDDQTVPIMALGGKGVISVLSNIMPREVSKMCALYLSGKCADAAKMQLELIPLISALFSEVNPIPVKTALAVMGYCLEEFRLPMCEMDEANRLRLYRVMQRFHLLGR